MRLERILATGLLALLAACSGISVDGAKKLATTGQSTASATADFIQMPQQKMQAYVEGLALVAHVPATPIEGKTCNPKALTALSTSSRASVDKVSSAYLAQAEVFRQLVTTYSAFGALASYDAEGEVEGGLKGLTAATNNLLKATSSEIQPLPDNISGALTGLAGVVADEAKKRKVKAASILIRERIEKIHAAIKEQWVGSTYVSTRGEQIRTSYEVASVLLCMGLADATPIARPLVEAAGLVIADPKAAPMSPTFRGYYGAGINDTLVLRANADVRAMDGAFAEALDSFQDLITAHRKLEAGEPPTMETLAERVQRIRTLVEIATPKK